MDAPDGGATDPSEFDDVVGWVRPPLPAAVEAKARLLLLDGLGCIIAGLRHPEVRRLAEALSVAFPGDVRLPGCATGLAPAGAAALGAAAMCWDEANEGLALAHGRPSLPVVPILLALGDRPLGRALAALALGYEVGARAGELWRVRPGMHVDGTWHALGAAAAAARLVGADVTRAIRLVACQMPLSLYRPLAVGLTGRNTYPAHAALLGVLAAAASQAGIGAPSGGFAEARVLALQAPGRGARTPAGTWLLLDAYLKPYGGVRHGHYAAEAAIAVRARLRDTRTIEAIRVVTYGEALRYAANRAPASAIAAQFSISFAVAAGLRFGGLGPDVYRSLDDEELRRLEALVRCAEDPSMTLSARRAARVTVVSTDGIVEAEIDSVIGDPDRPMTRSQAEAKFIASASYLTDAAEMARQILEGPL